MTDKVVTRKLDEVFKTLCRIEEQLSLSPEEVVAGVRTGALRGPERPPDAPIFSLPEGGSEGGTFARGTTLHVDDSGRYSGAALCSDGIVRKLTWVGKVESGAPVSAAVKVGNTTVAGFLIVESAHNSADAPAVKLVTNSKGKHSRLLPPGPFHGRRAEDRGEAR